MNTPFSLKLLRYTDPDRLYLARAAAIYLGKSDIDNIKRPLSIMKKRHALAIFRGESARFEFETSKVVYDHLITYTTADMRACAGLRANEATEFVPPAEDRNDDIYAFIAERTLDEYHHLVRGIDPLTKDKQKRKRLQAARAILPVSVKIKYEFQFNFLTLITIFQQRLWTPGAQKDTKEVVSDMWTLVCAEDPELWYTVYDLFGVEALEWQTARERIRKQNPTLYAEILDQYGKQSDMWS